jgi:SAM-dependent methyltransferase
VTIHAATYHSGKFLQETELLDCSRCCPWCGFAEQRNRVFVLQERPDVYLLKCPRCHGVSSSQVATDAALATYYGSYYADSNQARVTCGNPGKFAAHIHKYTSRRIDSPRTSVLDFGGGDGSIGYAIALELARQSPAMIDVAVIDQNTRLVASENPRVTLSHASDLEQIQNGGRFDLVLAGAVLEHLAKPAEITRRLLHMLSPGGYFYARTPFMVPLLKILERLHIPFDFTFPGHFHDLGQDFWENIIPTLGMDPREWRVERSRPSMVETSFSQNFSRTLLSYLMKAPWWLLRGAYPYTGGWEVYIHRSPVS